MTLKEHTARYLNSNADLITLVIYGFINTLFVYKYGHRFLPQPWIWVLIYTLMMILVIVILYEDFKLTLPYPVLNMIFILSGIAITILLSALVLRFDPQHIRVGRFPALYEWIDRILHGDFPYISATRPSGFPFLFALALPFFLLGDIGFLQIFTFVAFMIIIYFRRNTNGIDRLRVLTMLITAPIFLYEIVVRSDLFSNMVFIVLFLFACEMFIKRVRLAPLLLLGLLGGLLLSTRGIVLLIYVVYFGYSFKNQLRRGLVFASGVLAGFAASVLPFAFWNYRYFVDHGPFSIQSSYLPPSIVLGMIIVCVYLAFRLNSLHGVYRSISYMLFGVVFVAFILSVVNKGWHSAVHGDGFDISYFCFTLPYLLLTLNFAHKKREPQEYTFSRKRPYDR